MSDLSVAPSLALVIKLGVAPDAAQLQKIARQLQGGNLSATWMLNDSQQLSLLPSGVSQAANSNLGVALTTGEQALIDDLRALGGRGARVAAVEAATSISQQALSAMHACGIQTVVAARARQPGEVLPPVRRLPLGIWQVSEAWQAPGKRGLRGWFAPSPVDRLSQLTSGLAVVAIDLGRVGGATRAARQLDQFLGRVADGAPKQFRVSTLAEAAAELTARCTARPQRSILRAA